MIFIQCVCYKSINDHISVINPILMKQLFESKNQIRSNYDLWHKRMHHCSSYAGEHLLKGGTYGMKLNVNFDIQIRNTCLQTKFKKLPATGKLVKGSPDIIVQTCVWSPIKPPTIGDENLFVTFTFTPRCLVRMILINSRDEVPVFCPNFIQWVDSNDSTHAKRVHRESADDYMILSLKMEEKVITHMM